MLEQMHRSFADCHPAAAAAAAEQASRAAPLRHGPAAPDQRVEARGRLWRRHVRLARAPLSGLPLRSAPGADAGAGAGITMGAHTRTLCSGAGWRRCGRGSGPRVDAARARSQAAAGGGAAAAAVEAAAAERRTIGGCARRRRQRRSREKRASADAGVGRHGAPRWAQPGDGRRHRAVRRRLLTAMSTGPSAVFPGQP